MNPNASWRFGRVGERWEDGLDLRQRLHADALGRRAVDRDAGGAEATVEQELSEGSAERVAHDEWRTLELADDLAEVSDDLGHGQFGDHGRVLA